MHEIMCAGVIVNVLRMIMMRVSVCDRMSARVGMNIYVCGLYSMCECMSGHDHLAASAWWSSRHTLRSGDTSDSAAMGKKTKIQTVSVL